MIDRRLAKLVRPHPWLFTAATGTVCLVTALWWAQAVAMSWGLAALVRTDMAQLRLAAGWVLGCFLLRALAERWRTYAALRLGSTVRARLRHDVARAGLTSEHLHDADHRGGARVLAITHSVDGIDQYVSQYLPHVAQAWIMPPVLVAVLLGMNPAAAAVVIIGLVVATLGPRLWTAATARRGSIHSDSYEALASDLLESLRAMAVLRATGATIAIRRRLDARSDALHRATVRTMRASLGTTAVIDGGIQFGVVGGGLLAAAAAPHSARPFIVLMLVGEAFRPIRDLSGQWHAGYLGLSAMTQIEQALPGSSPLAVEAPEGRTASTPASLPTVKALRLDGLTFGWDPATPLLQDLSVSWSPGGIIGIAGPSGTGKSTLLDLVSGLLQPQQGSVFVRTPDGERDVRLTDVAVVSQHPALLTGTIRENLLVASPTPVPDGVLRRALTDAGLDDLLERGLDHELGEGGRTLSGGQRQRLAMARALVSPRPVLVLDEPTSALDAQRSERLLATLAREAEHRIVIMSAHRPEALAACSVVLDLQESSCATR